MTDIKRTRSENVSIERTQDIEWALDVLRDSPHAIVKEVLDVIEEELRSLNSTIEMMRYQLHGAGSKPWARALRRDE